MGMNETPSSERLHIAFFGRRNAGKSSLLNAVTGQDLAVVSEVRGTTTDPVLKSMELLPVGPVVIIDTPGLDEDATELGQQRVRKARQTLNRTDVAVLVADATQGLTTADREILSLIEAKRLPYVIAFNKSDLVSGADALASGLPHALAVSARTGHHIHELKELLAATAHTGEPSRRILDGLVDAGDLVVLVTPIDSAAPKGRLILPQQQTLRDVLDRGALGVVTRETELSAALSALSRPPRLVVTDSQAFGVVSRLVPREVPLTSFSILFSRYKGYLEGAVRGVRALERLSDGAKVLISEGCTHHRQCGDIGTQKLPKWISDFTGKRLQFEFSSGTGFPEDLTPYGLVVHCGGCMLNEREMRYRAQCAADQGVPLTNYGILIAHVHGILARSVEPLPDIRGLLG